MSEPEHLQSAVDSGPAKQRLSRLILTGFMGAGKSTVGASLAYTTGWRFLDLDTCIETACSGSVAEIFREHGEAYFRGKERELLEQLRHEEQVILALGGGTIEDPLVLQTLLDWKDACIVFLDAPLQELLGRMNPASRSRPLLTTPEELEARHRRRLPMYRAAHVTVATTGLAPREVASQVLENVRRIWRIEERGKGDDGKL